MIATTILILVTLIIALDSLGSKRIRSGIIKKAKSAFQAALDQPEKKHQAPEDLPALVQTFLRYHQPTGLEAVFTLRMKLKGAVRRDSKKYWSPLEAKLFVAPPNGELHLYQDRTLGFLRSRKTTLQYRAGQNEHQERLFSLFPLRPGAEAPPPAVLYWACLPWIPTLCLQPDLDWTSSEDQKAIFFGEIQKEKYRIEMSFSPKGQLEDLAFFSESKKEMLFRVQYRDLHEMDGRNIPLKMDWQIKDGERSYQCRYTITEVVYNEAFSWW